MLIKEYERNTQGRDFFVGDIHGEYNKLMDGLCRVKFNFDKDRLFSVGDCIDRGEDSLKCLTLLDEPWFYSIIGNHESMMLDAIDRDWSGDLAYGRMAYQLWLQNGGDWYLKLTPEEDLMLGKYILKVKDLPNGLEVGDIGVVHAECPLHDWELLKYDSGSTLREHAMWSRRRISRQSNIKTKNIEAVVVGHTPTKDVVVLGNHVYIDSGAVFNNKDLVILSYDEILDLVGG